jgi:ABC-2 type transport system permease protein
MTSFASNPPREGAATSAPGRPAGGAAGFATSGGRLGPLWTLYLLTLRQHLHGKRWIVMVMLFLVPAALAILVRALTQALPAMVLEFNLAFLLIPQALLPLLALLYASGIIQDEQEEQTITYLLVRPIPKWALYGVKLLATLTTVVLLTAVLTALCYAAVYLGGAAAGENVLWRCAVAAGVHSLAVVAYCCLFGLLSLVFRRMLLVGIIYITIVEALLANLPFGIRLVTVIYYARVIAYRTLAFSVPRPDGGTDDLAAEAWQINLAADPNVLGHPATSTSILVLLTGSLVCAILGAALCSLREFHVKTPEK